MFSIKSIHTIRQVRPVDLSTNHSHCVSINQCHINMGKNASPLCVAKKRIWLACFRRIYLFIHVFLFSFFKSETALFCNEVHPGVARNDTLAYIKMVAKYV